ncbi:collagen alpha-1(I) chain-like [Phaenicophaeus curvirostris]|uniref:collagen alpha-1(I) chain-like n=1 Tax=Phaenicophaeus curvirostris TaxID=33595 RepID=UPI0037F0A586
MSYSRSNPGNPSQDLGFKTLAYPPRGSRVTVTPALCDNTQDLAAASGSKASARDPISQSAPPALNRGVRQAKHQGCGFPEEEPQRRSPRKLLSEPGAPASQAGPRVARSPRARKRPRRHRSFFLPPVPATSSWKRSAAPRSVRELAPVRPEVSPPGEDGERALPGTGRGGERGFPRLPPMQTPPAEPGSLRGRWGEAPRLVPADTRLPPPLLRGAPGGSGTRGSGGTGGASAGGDGMMEYTQSQRKSGRTVLGAKCSKFTSYNLAADNWTR